MAESSILIRENDQYHN